MRYYDILRIYPDIESLFSGMSELIHEDNVTADMAAGWAERWISRYVAKEHQPGVADKARQFIAAICYEYTAGGIKLCNIQESFINMPSRN